ncbi:probable S-adenosylmethionine-dependent methyltransferase At5g38100 [Sesamum indicum]|uniref:Probable S-adenosylmethionine-dependent methyltransferase At5g38100 n=1 Tax=Sesamum indicum TaxID=4182 RepID=A0A8M8UV19_SESIN|nr:probable S-adenosylmethionine-dependent methyltransferase At5g38100 [Sesamum indicum]
MAFGLQTLAAQLATTLFQPCKAIYQKHAASSGLITPKVPKFFVVFNDVITNDFNTLFSSLPPHRNYNAVGVPGDFHARLLPESSFLFAYSSWALQWLTQVPKVVGESGSPAWNKGEILYTIVRGSL